MDEISDILGEYEQTIREGNLSLQDSLKIAQELLDKVSKIADNIKRITGADSYEDILKAMASDSTSVTFAFGNVGEALAIVVMVIQVAGSGGTFPIEALPKVFQWIYPFLPFQFGMKAFKECIAGMHGVDYWINVGKMTLFLIVALLLGLALEPPFRKLNHKIEKSKEKTGLMI